MTKFISLFRAILFLITLAMMSFGGCSKNTPAANSGDTVAITILMGKPEVAGQFEKMLANYGVKTGVNITLIPLAGQDAYEKMTTLYASGNAPTILMVGQEFAEFQDKFRDITDTSVAQKANEGTLDFVTVNDRVYGIPTTVEAYGIIYNPAVVKEALGESIDPSQIKTINELRQFLEALKAAGKGPFTLSPMDWSLGAHFSNSVFTAQSNRREERHQFLEALKSGSVSLLDNAVFNGWVDTLNVLLEYNIHAASPLAPVYEDGMIELAAGDAATWFMGNWAYPELAAVNIDDYQFIPVPLSNNAGDYGNGKIAIGVPSYWCIDKSLNSETQQQAALDFLSWFIETEEGQNYYVKDLNFIPAYRGFEIEPVDKMSAQIARFLDSGNTLEWMNTYYPAGGFQAMGASIQKYIDGVINRSELAGEFEKYWKSVK